MITPDDLIGKNLTEAKELLTGSKKHIVVVREEDKIFETTQEVDDLRIKVEIANGKIVSAKEG